MGFVQKSFEIVSVLENLQKSIGLPYLRGVKITWLVYHAFGGVRVASFRLHVALFHFGTFLPIEPLRFRALRCGPVDASGRIRRLVKTTEKQKELQSSAQKKHSDPFKTMRKSNNIQNVQFVTKFSQKCATNEGSGCHCFLFCFFFQLISGC